MGNIIDSFASGFAKVVGKIFGSQLDFLAGKSCSSACGSTWDFICYIENFCLANLLKLAMVLVLFYIVLLFLYLLYKLGICGCVGRTLCRMIWACFASCFYLCEYCCTFLWVKLHRINRKTRKHRRDIREKFGNTSEEFYSDESFSYQAPRHMEVIRSFSRRKRDYKNSQLRRSLRPRSHHARVEISRDLGYRHKRSDPIKHGKHGGIVHDIKVTQKSKFVHKGRKYREGLYQSQK